MASCSNATYQSKPRTLLWPEPDWSEEYSQPYLPQDDLQLPLASDPEPTMALCALVPAITTAPSSWPAFRFEICARGPKRAFQEILGPPEPTNDLPVPHPSSLVPTLLTFDIQLKRAVSVGDYISATWKLLLGLALALAIVFHWADRFFPGVTILERLKELDAVREEVLVLEPTFAHPTTRFAALKARVHRLCNEYCAAGTRTIDHAHSGTFLWGVVDIVSLQGLWWWLRGWRDVNTTRFELEVIKRQDGVFKGSRPVWTEEIGKAEMEIAKKTEEALRASRGRSAADAEGQRRSGWND
ncbi:hypothetical protein FB451DRAFT_1362295 [Mycena latifolia]|nr:hypothetical protein FB451DRAFT_1362295 [Mycena latifolia]